MQNFVVVLGNGLDQLRMEGFRFFLQILGEDVYKRQTVTGRTSPFESNSCVMPTFLPRMPVTRIAIFFSAQLGSFFASNGYWLEASSLS